ncbi:hypothetical protein [Endozoicomonas sp.]|uniref:hypothetical protein n=1 Tax=Endozoicomonas sp. TaxID=1892382 RepID=UPI002883811A|nr:hypothetical protein [Endozoicomonas sp.]
MDERVKRISTPEKCEIFIKNALARDNIELANQARLRAVQLRAEKYGADTLVEKEALEAIFAYETVLSVKNGKKTRATRTWQMIERRGIIEAIERAVNRSSETQGYRALVEMNLGSRSFESVILRHPEVFSDEAIEISKTRVTEWART